MSTEHENEISSVIDRMNHDLNNSINSTIPQDSIELMETKIRYKNDAYVKPDGTRYIPIETIIEKLECKKSKAYKIVKEHNFDFDIINGKKQYLETDFIEYLNKYTSPTFHEKMENTGREVTEKDKTLEYLTLQENLVTSLNLTIAKKDDIIAELQDECKNTAIISVNFQTKAETRKLVFWILFVCTILGLTSSFYLFDLSNNLFSDNVSSLSTTFQSRMEKENLIKNSLFQEISSKKATITSLNNTLISKNMELTKTKKEIDSLKNKIIENFEINQNKAINE